MAKARIGRQLRTQKKARDARIARVLEAEGRRSHDG